MMEQEYVITVMGDLGTPLAASVSGEVSLFSLTLMTIPGIILMIGILIYYCECRKHRERLHSLCRVMGVHERAGWNLWKLREEIMEMEYERVSLILNESW